MELRGCPRTLALLPQAQPATERDWDEEYLDLILAIRVVDDLDEAIRIAARIPPASKGTIEIRPVMEIPGLPEE